MGTVHVAVIFCISPLSVLKSTPLAAVLQPVRILPHTAYLRIKDLTIGRTILHPARVLT